MLIATLLLTLTATPEAEVARIQEHLRGASALLAQRDVTALTELQRGRRAVNAERLAAYTAAARFPKNRVVPGINPIFRDEEGTLCAVGALLWASGEHELVEHIIATRNTATVFELADEPGLSEWLAAQGLTLAEAARIQPGYAFEAFTVTTPSYSVPAGACSPPVQLARSPGASLDSKTNVWASSSSTSSTWDSKLELFEGDRCQTLLVPTCTNCSLYLSTSATLTFRRSEAGQFTFRFSNGSGTITQVHQVLLADGGMVDSAAPDAGTMEADGGTEPSMPGNGCSSHGGGLMPLFAGVVLLLTARRRVLT